MGLKGLVTEGGWQGATGVRGFGGKYRCQSYPVPNVNRQTIELILVSMLQVCKQLTLPKPGCECRYTQRTHNVHHSG